MARSKAPVRASMMILWRGTATDAHGLGVADGDTCEAQGSGKDPSKTTDHAQGSPGTVLSTAPLLNSENGPASTETTEVGVVECAIADANLTA